ncbi:DUF1858 domain-containing protein [Thermoproteota archaeon]
MTIGEILEKNPEVAEVMAKHGLHCIGCHVGLYEKLEDGCKAHGLDDDKIDLMVKEMNEKVEDGKGSEGET